ncbi:MAG TPA: NAD-dependent epimerase/dehydratase family protein [Acidimicrobiia bacterium]|nr:NAD-dependent epimerase/dehydratase family protein [Acidimicrobiia bacterium]
MQALVTGGAGFIGSHLVDALVDRGAAVRVLDNLETGLEANLNPAADFVEADVADATQVASAMQGVEVVFHEAALGSVPRSIENPLATNRANVQGTLTVLECARHAGVRRVVSASSSSVYGGEAPLPTNERYALHPKSPYAVSKVAGEQYVRVYASLLGLDAVCLRYFNVYGPRQRADSPYAAAIPKFVEALRAGRAAFIHGDGRQTRDFTFVGDAVQANLLAADAPGTVCDGRAFNIAGGNPASIVEVVDAIAAALGVPAQYEHGNPRPGDVRDSHADITAAREILGFQPAVDLATGLRETIASV